MTAATLVSALALLTLSHAVAGEVSTRDAAARAADEDRRLNLDERGDDANASEAVIAGIRRGSD